MRNETREGQLSKVRIKAVHAVLYRISQMLEAIKVQIEHKQGELGFPKAKITKTMEDEAESLLASLMEAVKDDLRGWVRMAISEEDEQEIVGLDMEGMEDEVKVKVMEALS
jgi:dsRNA-specific ribonuclease